MDLDGTCECARTNEYARLAALTRAQLHFFNQSLGGNDIFGYYAAYNGSAAMPAIEADLRTILDTLYATHPNVKLVMAGYDLYARGAAPPNQRALPR